jgi:hypothetical protein
MHTAHENMPRPISAPVSRRGRTARSAQFACSRSPQVRCAPQTARDRVGSRFVPRHGLAGTTAGMLRKRDRNRPSPLAVARRQSSDPTLRPVRHRRSLVAVTQTHRHDRRHCHRPAEITITTARWRPLLVAVPPCCPFPGRTPFGSFPPSDPFRPSLPTTPFGEFGKVYSLRPTSFALLPSPLFLHPLLRPSPPEPLPRPTPRNLSRDPHLMHKNLCTAFRTSVALPSDDPFRRISQGCALEGCVGG